MAERQSSHWPAGLLLECVLWFVAPAIFLSLYVGRFSLPDTAIAPHLRYMGAILISLLGLRAIAALGLGRWPRALRALSALLLSTVLLTVVFYYTLVLIGLNSWSRVPSWDLISGYLPQLGALADALQVSVAPTVCAVIALVVAATALVWAYLRRWDWALPFVHDQPPRMIAAYLFLATALAAEGIYHFTASGNAGKFEPLSMTVYPDETGSHFNSSQIDRHRAAMLDQKEDAARQAYQPNPQRENKNVVLIIVDALRSDHMGLYGYERDTTPFLSRIERDGKLHKSSAIRASCAESACGLFSLSASKFVAGFSERPITLQEVLRRHGYQVHMILGGDHTNFYGLRKVYGDVDSFIDGSKIKGYYANDDRMVTGQVDRLPAWNGKPMMLQLHLMSAHGLGKRFPENEKFLPAKNYISTPNAQPPRPGKVAPATRNYYDNGVLQTDSVIEKLIGSLQAKGYLANAIVIITADHGEGLGEHGLFAHSNGVHEELLRIPFVMLPFGYPAEPLPLVDLNHSQVDVAPTILRELAMPQPSTWEGTPIQAGQAQAFTYFQQGLHRGLVDYRQFPLIWKYWSSVNGGPEFAFELRSDPGETSNQFETVDIATKKEWRRRVTTSIR